MKRPHIQVTLRPRLGVLPVPIEGAGEPVAQAHPRLEQAVLEVPQLSGSRVLKTRLI